MSEVPILRKMKKQLECWYAKHLQSKRHLLPKKDDNYIGGSDEEHQPVLKLDDDDDAGPPQANAERGLGDGSVGIGINAHKFTCNK